MKKRILILLTLFSMQLLFSQKNISFDKNIQPTAKKLIITRYSLKDSISVLSLKREAKTVGDVIGKDTISVIVIDGGYTLEGLLLEFTKGKITPKYYYWDDGGGIVTLRDFDSYELVLNNDFFNWDETITGRFIGTINKMNYTNGTEDFKISIEGDFTHVMEDTPHKDERIYEAVKKREYCETGFYTTISDYYTHKYKLPAYKYLNLDEETSISYRKKLDNSIFKGVIMEQTDDTELKAKFLLKTEYLNDWTNINKGSCIYVVNNKLLAYCSYKDILENGILITVKTKDKAEKLSVYKEIIESFK
ncbi:hypothetical protein [Flavobacterium alkalisoli]|uniref:hypothetical protein n=1 Tax=Flavobacterium alkalisoli TaxID=2602769 RepID=UPI003A938468